MADHIQCEFCLLRYVPDAVKNEFVNIGVILREATRAETTRVQLTRDWTRVLCFNPDADTALLEGLESELSVQLREANQGYKSLQQQLEESLSNTVQLSDARGTIATSMTDELEQLMRLYVEPRREKVQRKRSGRALIVSTMRSTFERAGVWDMMRKRIAASQYTRPGDPLKLDCGYRPNGVVRMFHAVSLDGDLEAAKVLAFSAKDIGEGLMRAEKASLDLVAIVEPLRTIVPEAGEAEERYRFGVEVMEDSGVRVLTLNDLPRLAETVNRELIR